ncbi:hypothetical protein AB751O23_AA_00650, partial [Chlamydiales bacterium SCGC AB-751-O23]
MCLKNLFKYSQIYLKQGCAFSSNKEGKRRIYLTNLISASSAFVIFCYIPFFYSLFNDFLFSSFLFLLGLLYAFVPQKLNSFAYYRSSLTFFFFLSNISGVIYACLFPIELGVQLYFFSISTLPLVLFEFSQWTLKITCGLLSAFFMTGIYFFKPYIESRYIIYNLEDGFYPVFLTAFAINLMIVIYKSIL